MLTAAARRGKLKGRRWGEFPDERLALRGRACYKRFPRWLEEVGPEPMDEIKRALEEILGRYDLDDAAQRREAFEECLRYAEEELGADPACNRFLELVAKRLRQDEPAHFDWVHNAVPPDENSFIHCDFDEEQGLQVSANASGLQFLIETLQTLLDGESAADHTHLYFQEPPLTLSSQPIALFKDPDEWFMERNEEYEEPGEPKPRLFGPADVVALQPLTYPPEALAISRGTVYRVYAWKAFEGESAPRKDYPGPPERLILFTINDDRGERVQVAFHLDDLDVHYFTLKDLLSLLPARRRGGKREG